MKAFGLNRMDISQREGRYPPPAGASPILGVEFSGTIGELGKGVTQWKVNDEVLGLVPGVSFFAHDALLGLLDLCVMILMLCLGFFFFSGSICRICHRGRDAHLAKAKPFIMGRRRCHTRKLADR